MTLTFKHILVEYKHIQVKVRENMMFYSFDIDHDPNDLDTQTWPRYGQDVYAYWKLDS